MGGSSFPWEAFSGAAYPDLASKAANLSAEVYTKIFNVRGAGAGEGRAKAWLLGA